MWYSQLQHLSYIYTRLVDGRYGISTRIGYTAPKSHTSYPVNTSSLFTNNLNNSFNVKKMITRVNYSNFQLSTFLYKYSTQSCVLMYVYHFINTLQYSYSHLRYCYLMLSIAKDNVLKFSVNFKSNN